MKVTDLIDHILDKHVITLAFILFAALGAEQLIAGKITYEELLNSEPAAIALAGLAIGRGAAAAKDK